MKKVNILFFIFFVAAPNVVFSYPKPPKPIKPPVEYIVLSKLQAGEGGIVIRSMLYTNKKGVKTKDLIEYQSLQQIIENGMEKTGRPGGLFYILAPGSDKEKEVKPPSEGELYYIMKPPGSYIITRMTTFNPPYMISHRVYGKIDIEPGKIKYVGDFTTIMPKRSAESTVILRDYKIDEVKNEMDQKHPGLMQYLTEGKMMFE